MKFGKKLRSQMVPEWQEAYMEYDNLKTLLKEIQTFRLSTCQLPSLATRQHSLYRAFSGLTQRGSHSPFSTLIFTPKSADIESQVILLKSVPQDGIDHYQTTFLKAAEEGGEYEIAFFKKLDVELNKVVNFYKHKVEEVMIEATMLNKQMDALIAFRIKVDNPQAGFNSEVEMNRLASDISTSTAALSASTPSSAKASSKGSVCFHLFSIKTALFTRV